MPAPLSDEWIREQLALCAKATPGPWAAQWHAWDGAEGLRDQYLPLTWEGCDPKIWGMQIRKIGIDTTHRGSMRREDLLLISAARQGYALTLQALLDCREIARAGLNTKETTDASTE